MEETEGNSEENTNSTVVNSSTNNSGESMDDSQASSSKQHAEMLVKLRREKRTRKTKVTKLKHYLQKVCSINKDGDNNAEIENCVNELWEILEETQVVMDELSGLYLQLNDIKMHKEVMQESDNLQLDIQQTIDSAQEILVASPALSGQSKSSVQSATSPLGGDILTEPSHISPTTMQESNNLDLPSSNNTGIPSNQQQENPVSNTSSSHQVPTPAQQHEGTPAINRHLKPLRVPTFDGNKVKFEEFLESVSEFSRCVK